MIRSPSRALVAPLFALALASAACGSEVASRTEAVSLGASVACDGDDPEGFCDDCNPCTVDANCTPCSELPRDERDMHRCTPDDELPPFCAGKRGCVHLPVSTPPRQINDCFPVDGDPDLHPGVCRSGTCVENDTGGA